jgi:tripeptidyl-peptidase-1
MKRTSSLIVSAVVAASRTHLAPEELCCGWTPSTAALAYDNSQKTSFILTVKEQHGEKLRDIIAQVSDPTSSSYGQYLTRKEVLDLTAPTKKDLHKVTDWLDANGISYKVDNGRSIEVMTTIAQAERLLSTTYRTLRDAEGRTVVRAGDYTIPEDVDQVISGRFGLHGVPVPNMGPLTSNVDDGFGDNITPDVIHSTYNVSGVTPSGSASNRQAVAEFQGQNEKDEDLASFFTQFVPNAQPGDDKISKFVGDKDQQQAGVEAELDIQYIMGVAPHIQTEFWLWDNSDFCQDLVKWTQTILSDDAAPLVHSVSYGWQGDLARVGCQPDDVNTVDANFQKVTAQGISIIFASGDSGSGYQIMGKLYPSWPASSPYVTAVGATRFVGHQIGAAEMATDQFGSGGGFSSQFNQTNAAWQVQAVKQYTSNPPNDPKYPPQNMFDPNGRATPDICALGEKYQVVLNGRVQGVGGTSASTPAFAAMVSLLNEARAQKGKASMGLLNPFLYQNADCFRDVTQGTNAIGRGGEQLKYGFAAQQGWDPATGLGSPDFTKVLAAALNA